MKSLIFGAIIACIITVVCYEYPGVMPLIVGLMFGLMSMALTGDITVKDYIKQELKEVANELHTNAGMDKREG